MERGEKSEEAYLFEDEKDSFELEPKKMSALANVLGIGCFPFTLLGSWFVVSEQEEVVLLNFGKYTGTIQSPGVHWANCFGRDMRRITTQMTSINLPTTKVADANGNPLIVSGVVVYRIIDSKRAAIDVRDAHGYVANQSLAVMKQVVSQYPYEHLHEDDKKGATLKTEAAEISKRLVGLLQSKVRVSGASVTSFQFDEISYAPEIAQGMLKKQQAMATIAARKAIVEGAVEISYSAIEKLEARGVPMDPKDKTKVVANLLTVICAETNVQPTLNVTQS